MKPNNRWFALALALGLPAVTVLAQDGNPPPGRDRRPPREGVGERGPGEGMRRPIPPVMVALDSNHDGVIDEQEIEQASASLKKLDKNGDGKLTMEELRPAPPQGAEGDGPRRRGPRPGRDGTDGPDRPERPGKPQPPAGDQ